MESETGSAREPTTRRGFFCAVTRYALLAGTTGVVALLAGRRDSRGSRSACINDGLCRSCTIIPTCGLPAARSARRATRAG